MAWVAALIQVTTGTDLIEVVNLGVIAFVAFVMLTYLAFGMTQF